MPKVDLNPMLEGLSGKIGDVVFRYHRKTGKTSISKVPDMTGVKWSKAQKAQRQNFKKAVAYAHSVKANPEAWAALQKTAKKKHKRAWDLAIKDYFQKYNLGSKKKAKSQ